MLPSHLVVGVTKCGKVYLVAELIKFFDQAFFLAILDVWQTKSAVQAILNHFRFFGLSVIGVWGGVTTSKYCDRRYCNKYCKNISHSFKLTLFFFFGLVVF